nr:hypothetical protein [Akkermansia muciniphila]
MECLFFWTVAKQCGKEGVNILEFRGQFRFFQERVVMLFLLKRQFGQDFIKMGFLSGFFHALGEYVISGHRATEAVNESRVVMGGNT